MHRVSLRPLFPFFIATVAILCLELLVYRFGNSGNYNTDFFDFSPIKPDVIQKHVIYDKFELALQSVPSDAVQVGDSSGFFGVIPSEVSAGANGTSYLNLSCCADSGWEGHYYQAEMALRQEHGAKILVFHITPIWGPLGALFRGDNQLAGLIRDYILQEYWWHKVRPPSAGYRLRMTNLVYHGIWVDDLSYDIPPDQPNFPSIKGWREQYKINRGWVPQPWAMDDPWLKGPAPLPCAIEDAFSEVRFLGLWRDNALYRYLQRFAKLARSHGVRLVFITNPVPCVVQNDALLADVSEQMSRFKRDYPEVVMPFEFFREWPRREFKDRWHLNIEGAIKHSQLIGEVLRAVPR